MDLSLATAESIEHSNWSIDIGRLIKTLILIWGTLFRIQLSRLEIHSIFGGLITGFDLKTIPRMGNKYSTRLPSLTQL